MRGKRERANWGGGHEKRLKKGHIVADGVEREPREHRKGQERGALFVEEGKEVLYRRKGKPAKGVSTSFRHQRFRWRFRELSI